MTIMLAGFFGGWEIVLILLVALMLFGGKKLPELAKGLGQGIKEFKKATREVESEFQNAMDTNTPPPKRIPPATTVANEPAAPVPQNPPGQKA